MIPLDPTSLLPVIAFGALGVFLLFVFFALWSLFFPLVYFFTATPNRVVSALFSYKVWAAAALTLLAGIGFFLSDLLAQVGFRSETDYTWLMRDLRLEIVLVVIGLYLLALAKKALPMSIFDSKAKDDKKEPVLYTAHVFHTVLSSAMIVLEIVLLGWLLNWLLEFGLLDTGEIHEAGVSFFVNFLSLLLPAIVLGMFLLPSFRQKERLVPKTASEVTGIFQLIALLLSGGTLLISFGVLARDLLVRAFNNVPVLGMPLSMSDLRNLLVIFVLALILVIWLWRLIGGMKAYIKK